MPDDLSAFFRPRSVAILGASANPQKLGYRLVANMRATGYEGAVYPISRSVDEIESYPTVRSLTGLLEPPDLVLVSIPAEAVPEAISDAVSIGARAAIVLACGFAEAGAEGSALQNELVAQAEAGGMRLIGPNCMGVSDLRARLNATYFNDLPSIPGDVGFISQSGAFGGIAFAQLSRLGVGISKFASIGNMSDVTHAELIRYYGNDEETHVIAAFIEGVPAASQFLEAVREVSPKKPVVILKGGRTATGSAAAISHTGSLAGEAIVWESLMREAGATVAENSEDLFDSAAVLALSGNRFPHGNRLAIVTISGGPSVVAADACDAYGVELPNLEADLSELAPLVPSFASLRNPVDLTAQIDPRHYGQAVAKIAAQRNVDGLLAVNVGLDLPEFGDAFTQAVTDSGKPVVGYVIANGIEEAFAEAGIPNLPSVERAVRAFRRLHDRTVQASSLVVDEPRFAFEPAELSSELLAEDEAKRLLAEHGFLITREEAVTNLSDARTAVERIGYPVVLKVLSSEIAHKSDIGGVLLGIQGEGQLATGIDSLRRRFPHARILVQEQVDGGPELIIGGRRDPLAGPVVMVGLGGVLTEVFRDVSFASVPTGPNRALQAVARLRAQTLLDGFRGASAVDRAGVAELLERLSALLEANAAISEIDLNPVIPTERGLIVVDALIRTSTP